MSSLGIFNKETKTYQKVAGTAEAAVVDAEMSDTSTNTVQNKVVKSYVDGRTTLDTSMSDSSTKAVQNKVVKSYVDTRTTFDAAMSDTSTNAVQNKVVKSYVDGRTTLDTSMSDSSNNAVQNKVVKGYVDGTFKRKLLTVAPSDGKTSYCQLCTIKINSAYVNTPIEITLQERGRATLDRLTVLFESAVDNDPNLASFKVFGEFSDWYISKRATSTWVIYGTKNEPWGWIRVVDYVEYDGVNVTWDVTGVTALPDSKTKAVWGGIVGHAVSADSSSSASTVNGHTVNSDVPSNAVFTDTNTWRPLGTTADTACAGNDSRLSNARPASGGTADNSNHVYSIDGLGTKRAMTMNWVGEGGQPSWLWGGADGENMYVYNPSNFSVNYANSAGSVAWTNVSGRPSSMPANGGNSSTVNGHTVNSDVPSGAKFTDTTYNDATTSAHGLMTPAMVSKLNGIEEGANRTTVDTAMSDSSTNAVQNKVVKSYVDGTQTGYYVGSNPPTNKNILWIDSLHGGMIKYYASDTSKWHPVRAKGYDTPVDLINEGYWRYSLGAGITVGDISAIYDINTDKVTIIISNLSITSDAPTDPNAMVYINMPMYNLGHTGSINPVTVISASGSSIDMWMALKYPNGRIQTGPPYGVYKPATMQTIKFEISHPAF